MSYVNLRIGRQKYARALLGLIDRCVIKDAIAHDAEQELSGHVCMVIPMPDRKPISLNWGLLASTEVSAYDVMSILSASSSPLDRCIGSRAFDAATKTVVFTVFDEICNQLLIPITADSIREIIAVRIVELAHNGEHDPARLRDAVMDSIGVTRVSDR